MNKARFPYIPSFQTMKNMGPPKYFSKEKQLSRSGAIVKFIVLRDEIC